MLDLVLPELVNEVRVSIGEPVITSSMQDFDFVDKLVYKEILSFEPVGLKQGYVLVLSIWFFKLSLVKSPKWYEIILQEYPGTFSVTSEKVTCFRLRSIYSTDTPSNFY